METTTTTTSLEWKNPIMYGSKVGALVKFVGPRNYHGPEYRAKVYRDHDFIWLGRATADEGPVVAAMRAVENGFLGKCPWKVDSCHSLGPDLYSIGFTA